MVMFVKRNANQAVWPIMSQTAGVGGERWNVEFDVVFLYVGEGNKSSLDCFIIKIKLDLYVAVTRKMMHPPYMPS